jgi:hypothetical protein
MIYEMVEGMNNDLFVNGPDEYINPVNGIQGQKIARLFFGKTVFAAFHDSLV